jgi:hypothetical protein
VVVDHVEQDPEAAGVAGVDQPAQAVGPAVGVVRRPQVHAVVAPAAPPRELGHRHELDGVDSQVDQVVEAADGAVERALGRERPDVDLVQHRMGQVEAPPFVVAPGEGVRVDDPGQPVHTVGLVAGAGIGAHRSAVQ